MQVSIYGPHSFASCSDGARVVRQHGREVAERHGQPAQLHVHILALRQRADVVAPHAEPLRQLARIARTAPAACRHGPARSACPGNCRARSISSGSCGSIIHASNDSPRLPSSAKPSRNFGSIITPAGLRFSGPSTPGSASYDVERRMPLKRSPPAAMCASSTRPDIRAQQQLRRAHDPRARQRLAVKPARRHRRDAVDELRLAHAASSRSARRRDTSTGIRDRPSPRCCGRCRCPPAAGRAGSGPCDS